MVRNLILYIFIYVMLIGCGDGTLSNVCKSDCFLNITAPNLQKDEKGYYHMEWLEGYNQTFSTLDANTGSNEIVKVMWDSDSGINHGGYWVSSVNHASYTDDGIAHTVLSMWEEQINDTITIYSWYQDDCNIEYLDSIKVIFENMEEE